MISDYFAEDLIGGASLNDEEVVKIFAQEGEKIQKIRSDELSVDFLKENKILKLGTRKKWNVFIKFLFQIFLVVMMVTDLTTH